jgi:hypothetical protein
MKPGSTKGPCLRVDSVIIKDMHLELATVIGTLVSAGVVVGLAWDWWRHPMR